MEFGGLRFFDLFAQRECNNSQKENGQHENIRPTPRYDDIIPNIY